MDNKKVNKLLNKINLYERKRIDSENELIEHLRDYIEFDFTIVINYDGILLLNNTNWGWMSIGKVIKLIEEKGKVTLEDWQELRNY